MGVNTDLKLIAVNVNSIIANSKRYSLLKFIEEHTPDIVLLSETKLNHKHRITFEQYQCIRTDRPNSTQGGGTAILIKNEIAYKPITFTQLPNLNSLESTAIQLTFTNNTKLTIISVYAAGHYNISFTTEINHLFSQNNILADNSFFIIAGDLNARHPDWGDSTINSRGGYLKNWLSSNAIEYRINLFAPCQATYPKADSYLDLCLADARLDFHNTPSNKLSVWLKGLFYILTTYKFPAYLIRLLHNMLQNRSFITVSHSAKSSRTFKIEEGLQQGTVNSPLLFNIFNSKVLNEFGLNTNNNARSIAFADDLLIYLGGKYPDDSAQKLEKIVNKINTYYLDWHLKINASKCETILIRLPTKNLSRKKLNNWKNFEIKIHNTNESTPVPNKRQGKYLGVHIDDLLRLSSHPLIQLKKARTAFHANCKLFYKRHLQTKAKIICYALLVRPIITYACPLWFNQSASTMEKIRAFERACLRTCLNKYRSASSNYKHFIKNRVIYEEARLPRIDNFIIKLTRDYHAQCKNITSNPLIHGITNVDNGYLISCIHSGYIPPEGFTLLDKQGFIQNEHNTPTIYHWKRHKNNKKITFSLSNAPSLKYSTALPTTDINNSDRLNTTKYWWLTVDSKFLEEIRQRMRRKKNTYNKEIIPMCNSIKFKQAVWHLTLKRTL